MEATLRDHTCSQPMQIGRDSLARASKWEPLKSMICNLNNCCVVMVTEHRIVDDSDDTERTIMKFGYDWTICA